MKKLLSLFFIFGLSINTQVVMADDADDVDEACPVGLVTGLTIDQEFGDGVNAITRCLDNRKEIKIVMQVNKACRDTGVAYDVATGGYKIDNHANTCGATRGYGIAQMANMIKDWKITHGIPADKLDLNIIVHGGGGTMLLNNLKNNLKPAVEALIADGVKFHFCMNTIRGMARNMTKAKIAATGNTDAKVTPANVVSMVIPGVTYVTGGLTALADFQEEGYMYIQP